MVQYEMYFTNEYIYEIINELSKIMHIDYERSDIDCAMNTRDKNSLENIIIVRDNSNPEYFICVDCNDKDWIYPLIVRCGSEKKKEVNSCMLKWDNLIREEYDQDLTEVILDSLGNEDTLLKRIEQYYDCNI